MLPNIESIGSSSKSDCTHFISDYNAFGGERFKCYNANIIDAWNRKMHSKKTRQKRVICIPCDLNKHQKIVKNAATENF